MGANLFISSQRQAPSHQKFLLRSLSLFSFCRSYPCPRCSPPPNCQMRSAGATRNLPPVTACDYFRTHPTRACEGTYQYFHFTANIVQNSPKYVPMYNYVSAFAFSTETCKQARRGLSLLLLASSLSLVSIGVDWCLALYSPCASLVLISSASSRNESTSRRFVVLVKSLVRPRCRRRRPRSLRHRPSSYIPAS